MSLATALQLSPGAVSLRGEVNKERRGAVAHHAVGRIFFLPSPFFASVLSCLAVSGSEQVTGRSNSPRFGRDELWRAVVPACLAWDRCRSP